MSTRVTFSSAIYLPECFQEAISAYQGLCSVKTFDETPTGYTIEINPSGGMIDEKQLTHEFLNYLLNLALERHLEKA
jgi:hypothetical protein